MKILSAETILQLPGTVAADVQRTGLYGLGNSLGLAGLVRRLNASDAKWVSLIGSSFAQESLDASPLLFSLELPASNKLRGLLRWLCDNGRYTSSLIFLATPLRLDELAERLKWRLDAMLPDELGVMLRFFDARVFESLMSVLAAAQVKVFLSPAVGWWYLNRYGLLCEVAAEFEPDEGHYHPIVFDVRQEAELLDACEPDLVAQLLRPVAPVEFWTLNESRRYEFILSQTSAARQCGVVATHELALYCLLALCYGEEFANGAPWSTLLQEVSYGRVTLLEAVSRTNFAESEAGNCGFALNSL